MPTFLATAASRRLAQLAVALVVALVPGVSQAQGAVGTWAQNGDQGSCSPNSRGRLVVSHTGIQQGDSKCWFGNTAPKGFAAVRGNMACSAGGNDRVAETDIKAVGDRLTVLRNGNHTAYERCRGSVSAPVFDDGARRRGQGDTQRRARQRQIDNGQAYREPRQVYRRQVEPAPAPLTEQEAATRLIIDLLSRLSNGR